VPSGGRQLARAEAQLQRIKDAQEKWWLGAQRPPSQDVPSSESERDVEDDLEPVLENLAENAHFKRPFRLAQEGRFFRESSRRPATFAEFYEMLASGAHEPRVRGGMVVGRSHVSRVAVGEPSSRLKLLRRIDEWIDRASLARRVADQKQGASLDQYRSMAEAKRHTA
jgi:hypothetical protein